MMPKPKLDTENPAAVRQPELARGKHQEQQEAKDEDAFAAHRLAHKGRGQNLLPVPPGVSRAAEVATKEMQATQRNDMVPNHLRPGKGSMEDWNISWITRNTTIAPAT